MDIYNRENDNLIEKIKEQSDLITALTSGLIILLAWRMDTTGLTTASVLAYLSAFIVGGYKNAKEGIQDTIRNKNLNVELLMVLAAIGTAITGYWILGAVLIFIFAVIGAAETYTLNKNKKELHTLMKLQPDEAWLVRGSFEPMKVPVSTLTIGDHLLIRPGERIPADGQIIKGCSKMDESVITGESVHVTKKVGHEVFAGTVNQSGTIRVNITKPISETLFQNIVTKAQYAKNEKSSFQRFIERFECVFVKVIFLAFILMILVPYFFLDWELATTLYRAMIFLVITSPIPLFLRVCPKFFQLVYPGKKQTKSFRN